MNKIIILFGQNEPVLAAKRKNFYVINFLMDTQIDDEEYTEAYKSADETIILYDTKDIFYLSKDICEKYSIDGIYSFTDTRDGVFLAAFLSEKLLKTNKFISSNEVDMLRNKGLTRKKIHTRGLKNIPFIVTKDTNKLENFLKNERKIIIKPLDGQASKNVCLISNEEELKNFCINKENCWISEKYIDGQEYSVEGIFINGSHHILGITKKTIIGENNYGHNPFVELAHEFPAPIEDNRRNNIEKYVQNFYKGAEAINVFTHTEVRINNSDEVFLIEGQYRPGGDAIPKLILAAYNLDIYDLFFKSLNSINDDQILYKSMSKKKYKSAMKYYIPRQTGKFSSAYFKLQLNDNSINDLKNVYINYLNDFNEGKNYILPAITGSFDRIFGGLLVKVNQEEEPIDLIDNLFENIHIEFVDQNFDGNFF